MSTGALAYVVHRAGDRCRTAAVMLTLILSLVGLANAGLFMGVSLVAGEDASVRLAIELAFAVFRALALP